MTAKHITRQLAHATDNRLYAVLDAETLENQRASGRDEQTCQCNAVVGHVFGRDLIEAWKPAKRQYQGSGRTYRQVYLIHVRDA